MNPTVSLPSLPYRFSASTAAKIPRMRVRSMTLPTAPGREDPLFKPATKGCEDPAHGAAFIFLHGLGDSGKGLESIPDQFQENDKLSYMHWILPNASVNHEARTAAWYKPTSFAPVAPSRPELAEDEDETGMRETVAYVESLIDACVNKGVPPNRIVLGGFSQGCAMALLTDLVSSKYSGRLAGIVGLMGYLPLAEGVRIQHLRALAELPPVHGEVPVFLARGEGDPKVPMRLWTRTLEKLKELGLSSSALEKHEYAGLGHSLDGQVMRDMCAFLERAVPKLED